METFKYFDGLQGSSDEMKSPVDRGLTPSNIEASDNLVVLTPKDDGLKPIYNKVVYLNNPKDRLPRDEMIIALRHHNYQLHSGKKYGNNISIALQHRDTKLEYKINKPNRFDMYLGKNLTISCLKNLIELSDGFGWTPIITRTRADTILVEMWKQW